MRDPSLATDAGPAGKNGTLPHSTGSVYSGQPKPDELYDRLRKHAYTGKRGEQAERGRSGGAKGTQGGVRGDFTC